MPNLANQYRPERFENVLGQKHPVRVLSGLIKRGQLGRHILFFGAVGSGKTSLARIYAHALNCPRPSPVSGSPCMECNCCLELAESYFIEYDVPGQGGDAETIRVLLRTVDTNVLPAGKRQVVFLDEAHHLTREAQDILLKRLEDGDASIVYILATTEPEALSQALESRLLPLEVHALDHDTAVELLQRTADAEGIKIDPDAVTLLANLRNGYPRDLLGGLELAYDPKIERITSSWIKEIFNVDHLETLPKYFEAVARGDITEQLRTIEEWREPPLEKLRWIQAFAANVYLNDILGRRARVDAAIDIIGSVERSGVMRAFARRLQSDVAQLAGAWDQMLAFWQRPAEVGFDAAALALRVALVDRLVDGLAHDAQGRATSSRQSPAGPASFELSASGYLPRPDLPPSAPPRPAWAAENEIGGFLGPSDVRELINAASFLTQEHGLLFNAVFEVQGLDTDAPDAVGSILNGVHAHLRAEAALPATAGDPVPSLSVFEGQGRGIRAHIAVHLTQLREGAEDERGSTIAALDRLSALIGPSYNVSRRLAPLGETARLKFHWQAVRSLLAGLSEGYADFDPLAGEWRPLLDLLNVPRSERRRPQRILPPLVHRSEALTAEAIGAASANRMWPVSAFDDRAWGEIASGWERSEYVDRQETKRRRAAELRRIDVGFEKGTEAWQRAKTDLVDAWPLDPRRRARSQGGWW